MKLRTTGALLSLLLLACATTQSVPYEDEPPTEVFSSFEEGCEDERTLVLLCAEEECGFFQCRDTLPGEIVPARGGGVITPPAASGGSPRRWWRRWPWLRRDSRPVLTFRLRASLDPKPQIPLLPSGRYVRHHIFPRAPDLAEWFRERGVEIHNFSLVIPEHVHRRIHSEGERGGLWNNTWRRFRDGNLNATTEDIYRQAGKMIYEFELTGPVIPYYSGRR